MFNDRIFDSSVERAIPSLAAAPDGPKTRPWLSRKASPKAMGRQIGEACEYLPLRRGVREAVIEADIKYECFACRVADGRKIADGVAPEKRLREVPHFTGEGEVPEERVGNRELLRQ